MEITYLRKITYFALAPDTQLLRKMYAFTQRFIEHLLCTRGCSAWTLFNTNLTCSSSHIINVKRNINFNSVFYLNQYKSHFTGNEYKNYQWELLHLHLFFMQSLWNSVGMWHLAAHLSWEQAHFKCLTATLAGGCRAGQYNSRHV